MKQLGWIVLATLTLAGCNNQSDTAVPTSAPTSAQTPAQQTRMAAQTPVVIYKSPSCKCCTAWADHLRDHGFKVTVHQREDMDAVKTQFGITQPLASCHTAQIGGYIIEGHVPADDVVRLLQTRPDIAGLTAPGMPMKSPGMQPSGLPPKGYQVLAFDKAGHTTVFHSY